MISCVDVGDWNEAECFDKFSDFVIVFDSLYLLSEWIHFDWLELGFVRWRRLLVDGAIRIAVVVAGLLSVPGLRHVGAQEYACIMGECYITTGSVYPLSEHVDIFPVRLVSTFPLSVLRLPYSNHLSYIVVFIIAGGIKHKGWILSYLVQKIHYIFIGDMERLLS